MIKSMTAFGRGRREYDTKDITVEIKSVNSRFFDCNVKMPRVYLALEEKIKSYVKQKAVGRAKVDVFVTVANKSAAVTDLAVDTELARSYLNALRGLSEELSVKDDVSVSTLVRLNPEILKSNAPDEDMDAAWEELLPALDEAIEGYVAMRTAEGAKLEADIKAKIEVVRGYSDEVEKISAEDTVGYREKLEARLRSILADNKITIDEQRVLTECAVWADKIAIDEELVRLRSHFDAFYNIIAMKEPSGRKLDFLMQELNRETNTIGSKANNAKIARFVVDMKGELEKIREQVQNIE
ncbi:MAG: YicC family protein [Clostridia bacterium]|nr:YicC family protein [Clostridia bacterium]